MTQTQQTMTHRKFTHHELEDLVHDGALPRGLDKDQREFFIELNDLIEPLRNVEAEMEHIEELTDELETANNVIDAVKKALAAEIG